MGGFTVGVLLSFLTISASASSVEVGDSPVTCSSEGVECDRTEDNLIEAVAHVMSVVECRCALTRIIASSSPTLVTLDLQSSIFARYLQAVRL